MGHLSFNASVCKWQSEEGRGCPRVRGNDCSAETMRLPGSSLCSQRVTERAARKRSGRVTDVPELAATLSVTFAGDHELASVGKRQTGARRGLWHRSPRESDVLQTRRKREATVPRRVHCGRARLNKLLASETGKMCKHRSLGWNFVQGTFCSECMARKKKKQHWSELVKRIHLDAWTRVKIQECYHEVRQEGDQRRSIVQQVMQKSSDFLRRIIVPSSISD